MYTMNSIPIPTAGVIIAGLVDHDRLYCGSRDLLSATAKGAETTYCTISGSLLTTLKEFLAL